MKQLILMGEISNDFDSELILVIQANYSLVLQKSSYQIIMERLIRHLIRFLNIKPAKLRARSDSKNSKD